MRFVHCTVERIAHVLLCTCRTITGFQELSTLGDLISSSARNLVHSCAIILRTGLVTYILRVMSLQAHNRQHAIVHCITSDSLKIASASVLFRNTLDIYAIEGTQGRLISNASLTVSAMYRPIIISFPSPTFRTFCALTVSRVITTRVLNYNNL